ncbi:MAG: PorT family protein [Bacteroidales bacterium]|nr:PorT family protein [Bacteroidales bacterium]
MNLARVLSALILLIPLLFHGKAAAQARVENMPVYDFARYHFGFILAVNQMHFTIKPVASYQDILYDSTYVYDISADSGRLYSIEHQPTLGFTVGIVGNLRLGEYFDLRFIPSLSFGERYLNYRILKYRNGEESLLEIRKDIASTYIDLPLHVKYKSKRQGNFRAYILSGASYRLDLASEAKKKKESAQVVVKLNRQDINFEAGVGFDYYFEWFKFGTEIKMSYGILDILKKEQNIYTDGIEKLTSKIFQVSFTFE